MSAIGEVIYNLPWTDKAPMCEHHLIDMTFQEPWSTETDRGWIEHPGFWYCRECDKEIDRTDYFQDSP
jgi:hypothetical protein